MQPGNGEGRGSWSCPSLSVGTANVDCSLPRGQVWFSTHAGNRWRHHVPFFSRILSPRAALFNTGVHGFSARRHSRQFLRISCGDFRSMRQFDANPENVIIKLTVAKPCQQSVRGCLCVWFRPNLIIQPAKLSNQGKDQDRLAWG